MSAGRPDASRPADVRRGVPMVEVPSPGVAALRLRWEISAEAVRLARPDFALDAKCERVMLDWTVPMTGRPRGAGLRDGGEDARAELVDPVGGSRTTLAVVSPSRDDLAGPVKWIHDSDLHHIEIDGLLHATVRITAAASGAGGTVEVLYARTELMARMGVPGGRYEAARGVIEALERA